MGLAEIVRLLDLFCGAGGAAMGYSRAGFEVVGVDIKPQPNYPFEFIQGDVRNLLRGSDVLASLDIGRVDAIHASPPCQFYSYMSACRPGLAAKYPALIEPVRNWLNWHYPDVPYVIENVPGAPLHDPVMLCGGMFSRPLYRHRLFEVSGFDLLQPTHPDHLVPASRAGHWETGTVMSIAGHVAPVAHARLIMDMDWSTRDELVEAIPPYYTEHVGTQLIEHLNG